MVEKDEEETEGKQKKGRPDDYLPERRKYEQLCRGEGLRMVRREGRHTLKYQHLFNVMKSSRLFLSDSSQAEPPLLPLL